MAKGRATGTKTNEQEFLGLIADLTSRINDLEARLEKIEKRYGNNSGIVLDGVPSQYIKEVGGYD